MTLTAVAWRGRRVAQVQLTFSHCPMPSGVVVVALQTCCRRRRSRPGRPRRPAPCRGCRPARRRRPAPLEHVEVRPACAVRSPMGLPFGLAGDVLAEVVRAPLVVQLDGHWLVFGTVPVLVDVGHGVGVLVPDLARLHPAVLRVACRRGCPARRAGAGRGRCCPVPGVPAGGAAHCVPASTHFASSFSAQHCDEVVQRQ